MGIKETIIKGLSRATSDKTELNQTILKYKKKFDEASAALGSSGKKTETYMRTKMEMKLTSANFDAEVLKSDMPVVVDFFATWCGPCKMMAPVIETLASEYDGKVKIGKLDVDENSDIAAKYGVMSIPTIILFKNGEAVKKTVGVQNKAVLENAIKELL